MHNNIPCITLYDQTQIKLKTPVSLSEIGLFEGDSVTVSGKVFTARYLENTKTKPTLLNIGAPYPDQPLTVVIENENRKKFPRPEEEYLHKTVRITGKVVSLQGNPQIVLYNTEQIEVLEQQDASPSFASVEDETTNPTLPLTAPQPLSATNREEASALSDAEFPGGSDAFRLFLRENLQYPEGSQVNEQKQVVASFQIDATGTCRYVKIVRSAGFDYDNEVKRVLLRMPMWRPAMRNGVRITTTVTQPVTFQSEVVSQK
jgi:TonB family protein